jgi:hypothetical protein
MRKIILSTVIATFIVTCTSCKTTKYIPIETTKIEYRDNLLRDSIIHYDSVYVKDKGDTLIMERYKYLYKNRIVKDSIFINDTILVSYPIEVVKQVKTPLTSWQNFQLWCGRIALVLVVLVVFFLSIKSKKF